MRLSSSHLLRFLAFAGAVSLGAAMAEETPHQRFSDAPHNYFTREPKDAFSKIMARISAGEVKLDTSSEKTQLTSLLKALNIPVSSQLLVYSATSFQGGLIRPANPRALYFNEEIYVGFVPGGRFEVAAIDPDLGPVFRIFRPTPDGRPEVSRTERCMNCHAGRTSWQVPGLVVESVICTNTGASLDGFRREQVGHTIPLADRFGGWHVTGAHEHGKHLGNLMGEAAPGGYKRLPDAPGSLFDWNNYPVSTSDLFTHLIHEHQLGFHNLVTLGVYRTRDALTAGKGKLSNDDATALNDIARQLVRYLLFANEAKLPEGGLKADPAYVKDFLARRQPIANGASLRDLDLRGRLFKYRCSYMIQTPSFAALPKEFKDRVMAGLATALREQGAPPEFNYLPPDEKRAIRTILNESRTGVF
ncbi:MAG: hypothetical protein JWO89_666 [Verrucomicrobiaceae bacterium]|nr:hypothetical protein [Verrucomicrobiaceae bacterium]